MRTILVIGRTQGFARRICKTLIKIEKSGRVIKDTRHPLVLVSGSDNYRYYGQNSKNDIKSDLHGTTVDLVVVDNTLGSAMMRPDMVNMFQGVERDKICAYTFTDYLAVLRHYGRDYTEFLGSAKKTGKKGWQPKLI